MLSSFYKGRKVLITGHTGFKGAWMCRVLSYLGADIIGYSLKPPTKPNLYELSEIGSDICSITGDVRNYDMLASVLAEYKPELVIHMAAQPLVGEGYRNPRYTYETNVMGTVNVLEATRNTSSVKSFLNITTDKVYLNHEWMWGYRENEELNGYDPYSNSKSCSELITSCYSRSFSSKNLSISTARAGNVIGGGDFTNPRIIPDCMRAALDGSTMILRNPHSIRPYQHVLEPVCAYLMIAAYQYNNIKYSGSYNVGPDDESCVDNESLVKLFSEKWGSNFNYEIRADLDAPHEANYLKLDISKIKNVFGWNPLWSIEVAIEKTVDWIKEYQKTMNVREVMNNQIKLYLDGLNW